jgi:hypothetical protein
MKRLLLTTRGKVFTLRTVEDLVAHSDIAAFVTRDPNAADQSPLPLV